MTHNTPITPDWVWELRKSFPILERTIEGHPLLYFDSAATAHKPKVVIDAISRFYSHDYGTVHRAIYSLARDASNAYYEARKTAARFLNSPTAEEIIFTRGTTESINLVAHSLGDLCLNPGDEILITEVEHHANLVPWQMIAERKGAVLKVAPILDNGELNLIAFQALLSPKTKIVAVPHISNILGTVFPVKEIAKWAHKIGAYVLVDGAQAAPHMPVDVQELGCDFYVFSGHKLYGPTGIGVLYSREELLDKMPPYQGGGDMIDKVTFEKTTYAAAPLKFEAGTPMIAEVIGLKAAIDWLQSVGLEKIHAWEEKLHEYLVHRLKEIPGLKILGEVPGKAALCTFIVEGVHPLDLATFLDLQGICVRTGHHCSQTTMRCFDIESATRVSFGCYNTVEEVNRFCEVLEKSIARAVK
jgi:cysteine desulfurase/selenocysteine lyase